ncbi:MAG: primase TraC [Pseudomonadota bacterium]|jgi:putative DNA primase/helicase
MKQAPRHAPRAITAELVREALSFIPPDIGHDERARVAFAVFDGIGDAGADLWLDWAGRRGNPDPGEDRATWRSAGKPGPVKVGTLFGMAKDRGFRFPEAGADAPAPDPAALVAAAAERARKRQADEAHHRERADRAARDARDLWADARVPDDAGASPYLTRKGVGAHGVRVLPDGALLVPMHDDAGELQNVQRIAPARPAGDAPEKRFMPGGRKTGLFHLIGMPAGAAASTPGADTGTDADTGPPVLLLGEGYATCASLHEATGRPVAVCFDAGNLKPCAVALRGLFPDTLLLVCGDDDSSTEARTGTNPGRVKAAAAARAGATDTGPTACVFPAGLPEGGSDFNDLAAHAGADAVRTLVEDAIGAAIAAHCAAPAADGADDADAAAAPEPAPGDESDPPAAEHDAGDTSAPPTRRKGSKGRRSRRADDGDAAGRGDRFMCNELGVWFTPPPGPDGTTGGARRVCDRLEVLALARDMHDKGGALLLDFDTAFGRGRRWLMPLPMLAGDGAAYRAELLDMGFHAPTDSNRRRWLTEYLESRRPAERVRLVDRVGWQGKSYVLPRETLTAPPADAGDNDGSSTDTPPPERLMFHSDAPAEDTFTRRGTLAQWQERIGRHCVGNSRLLFAASAALAGPLLAWLSGAESGGFHLRGDSSCGKTTALRVAASIWGGRDYLQRWRATDNGLEAQAAQHSDALLVLDELGQLDAKVAGESAYMLANGQGKARAGRNGGARPRLSWRLLWLSAGEIPLSQHMAEAGKRIRAGQELRMVDMPADAGAGLGLFETVHDSEGGAALSQHLAKACETTHGTLGRAWLEWLTAHAGEFHAGLRADVDRITADLVPETADGQVQRAGRRFALVAAAGELATRQGLTGWPEGEATAGVRRCFLAWVGARAAGFGSSERTEALRQVRAWLEKNGDALLTWWHRANDDHKPNTALRAGFKRFVDEHGTPVKFDSASEYCDARAPEGGRSADGALVEYMIFPEAFKNEVCKGLDAHFVARVLKDAGCLKHERDRLTFKHRLPGIGPAHVFHVQPGVFGLDAER